MAATQKTLTPTNEVISIPAFADKPDYRLPIDSTGKLADAINALDSKMVCKFIDNFPGYSVNDGWVSDFIGLPASTNQMSLLLGYDTTATIDPPFYMYKNINGTIACNKDIPSGHNVMIMGVIT